MSDSQAAFPETARANFDPGFTQRYDGVLKRAINKDGAFNVKRVGRNLRDFHLYMTLINVSWPTFALLVTLAFTCVNFAFACIYLGVGIEHIRGAESSNPAVRFLNLFFFSWHTLTTVGYGNMYPQGIAANAVAALEALLGLMAFAVATGLMFGRFSRPTARFGFSDNMLIAPYRDGASLQFRVVNRRSNNLIEVQANVLLMTVESIVSGKPERRFTQLDLERPGVIFFPLTWTIVHPINDKSPLWRKTKEDLLALQAEILIMIRAFDDTFGQPVYAKYSYRYDEIVWGAKFSSAFDVDPDGDLLLFVDKVGVTEPASLAQRAAESSA